MPKKRRPSLSQPIQHWMSYQADILNSLLAVTIAGGGGGGAAYTPILFQVGEPGAPTAGSTTYSNPDLEGRTLLVYVNGGGYLEEGVNYSFSGDTITLLDQTFDDGVIWAILRY